MSTLLLALTFFLPRILQLQADSSTAGGQLLNVDGTPAGGIRVAVMAAAEGSDDLISLTQTDSAGRFRLENIPPGRYIIIAGSIYYPVYYPGKLQRSEATAITFRSGATLNGMNFRIVVAEGVNVRGRFIYPGDPTQIDYANPTVRIAREGSPTYQEAPLNPDGSFELRNIPPGPYSLTPTGKPPIRITVPETGILSFEARVPSMVQVLATMSVEGGGAPPQVSLSFEGGSQTFSFGSADRGLGIRLPEGEYKMRPSLPPGYSVKSMTLNGTPVLGDRLTFSTADRDLQLRITLSAAVESIR